MVADLRCGWARDSVCFRVESVLPFLKLRLILYSISFGKKNHYELPEFFRPDGLHCYATARGSYAVSTLPQSLVISTSALSYFTCLSIPPRLHVAQCEPRPRSHDRVHSGQAETCQK